MLNTQQQHVAGSVSESGINATGQGTKPGATGLSCGCNYDMDSKRTREAGKGIMKLKNVLIVVDDMEESIRFYHEMFGLQVIMKQEGNTILSEGLVLQDAKVWANVIGGFTTQFNNMTELYFEDNDIEGFVDKLTSSDIFVTFQTELTELDGEKKMVRFYDPSGNLIEVRTPVNYN